MNLSFKTKWPKQMAEFANESTCFPERIMSGMNWDVLAKFYEETYGIDFHNATAMTQLFKQQANYDFDYPLMAGTIPKNHSVKIHSIRIDEPDRWKVGNDIHFIINNRQPDRFQFAPIMKVKSTQNIKISRVPIRKSKEFRVYVHIGARQLNSIGIVNIAANDGFNLCGEFFNSVNHFFHWFNEELDAKIIHWTDQTY